MKLAIVIHDIKRRGGQERSTLEIVEGLSKKNECHVFASSAEGLPSNVVFHKVPILLRRPLIIKDFVFRVCATIQTMFGRYDFIHATGASVFKADFFTMQFLHKRWNIERRRLPAPSLLRRLKENLQVTIDRFSEALVISLNPNATYIAISGQVQNDLAICYGLKNIVTIRHGVNLEEFVPAAHDGVTEVGAARRSLGLPVQRKLLLFVGAFERKGLFFLLQSLGLNFKTFRDWDLIVIGEGPVERAKAVCSELEINDRVHFLGSKRNVADYYAACDLFILPSLYDPFGLVAIEALACGCPVIVSKDSGSFDLLSEGVNGWGLRDAGNVKEITSALDVALNPSVNLANMRSAARQSVINEAWPAKITQYQNAYLAVFSKLKVQP